MTYKHKIWEGCWQHLQTAEQARCISGPGTSDSAANPGQEPNPWRSRGGFVAYCQIQALVGCRQWKLFHAVIVFSWHSVQLFHCSFWIDGVPLQMLTLILFISLVWSLHDNKKYSRWPQPNFCPEVSNNLKQQTIVTKSSWHDDCQLRLISSQSKKCNTDPAFAVYSLFRLVHELK